MCKHGTYEHVLVYLPAELSYTGEARFDIKPVDKCIAPIVRALTNAGIYTITSCCGHGKTDGQIDLLDGRKLMIVPTKQSESMTTNSDKPQKCSHEPCQSGELDVIPKSDVQCKTCGSRRIRIVYTDDEKTEVKMYDCTICSNTWRPKPKADPNLRKKRHFM